MSINKILFLFISMILLRISMQESEAQTCISSVYPTTIYFDYNPSTTNDIEAIDLSFYYWCDTYEVVPSEEWIIILHIDYEEGIVYVVTDDNFECSSRYGYITIDGYYNVDVEQDPGVPSWPGYITGSESKCTGTSGNYSVTGAQGATSHTWAVTNGASITSGQSTTSVTIYFPNGGTSKVSVKGVNSCGDGDLSDLNVSVNTSVPAQPGTISGDVTRCQGTSGSYSISAVQGAASYTWGVTNGGSIVSGQGTSNVSISFPSSGNTIVSVYAVNGCGNGTSRTLEVTVNALPTVSASSNNPVWSESTINLSSTGGFSNYSWTGPVSFSSNQQNPSRSNATTDMDGNYYVTITDANGCTNNTLTHVTVNALPYLYVSNSNKYVGMGGVYDPQYPLHIKGGNVFFNVPGYSTLRFKLTTSVPAICTNKSQIQFRTLDGNGWIDVRYYYNSSDSTAKKDIQTINNSLNIITQLRGVSYSWKKDLTKKKNIGLIAQEAEKIIPEIVYTDKSTQEKSLAYRQIIPYLSMAVIGLNNQVEKQNILMEGLIDHSLDEQLLVNDLKTYSGSACLQQITPKSYNTEINIPYIINNEFANALINIYNSDGYQIFSFKNIIKGEGEILINRDQLKPGKYIYILIIDGKEIDEKIMIIDP